MSNLCFSSEVVGIAEHKNYLELVSRICYYDEANKNNVMLSSENALEKAQTLVNMPVQAKYRVNSDGDPTFGGHEVCIDSEGDVHFGTYSIGTHTRVYIEDADVSVSGTIKHLPCLYAEYRIWSRYENYVDALKRLYSLGKLYGSWEITVGDYTVLPNGIKRINDYEFIANTLLGYENATPAYGADAKAISLSSDNGTDLLMVAEALSQDVAKSCSQENNKNNNMKEGEVLEKEKDTNIEEQTVIAEDVKEIKDSNSEENSEENSENIRKNPITCLSESITYNDIYDSIINKIYDYTDAAWCYIEYFFPIDSEAWVKTDTLSALEYYRITYSYNAIDNKLEVSEPQIIELKASVKDVVNDINIMSEKYDNVIAEKDNIIVQASAEIEKLKKETEELAEYKEKYLKEQEEKEKAEFAQKRAELIDYVVQCGRITREEIEQSEEMSKYADNLDKEGFMAIIGSRIMAEIVAKLKDKKDKVAETEKDKNKTVMASKNKNNTKAQTVVSSSIKTNLNNNDDGTIDGIEDTDDDKISIMRRFIKK